MSWHVIVPNRVRYITNLVSGPKKIKSASFI